MPWPPKTVAVTYNSDPKTVRVINEADFDAELMTKTDGTRARAAYTDPAPEKKKRGRPRKAAKE